MKVKVTMAMVIALQACATLPGARADREGCYHEVRWTMDEPISGIGRMRLFHQHYEACLQRVVAGQGPW